MDRLLVDRPEQDQASTFLLDQVLDVGDLLGGIERRVGDDDVGELLMQRGLVLDVLGRNRTQELHR